MLKSLIFRTSYSCKAVRNKQHISIRISCLKHLPLQIGPTAKAGVELQLTNIKTTHYMRHFVFQLLLIILISYVKQNASDKLLPLSLKTAAVGEAQCSSFMLATETTVYI